MLHRLVVFLIISSLGWRTDCDAQETLDVLLSFHVGAGFKAGSSLDGVLEIFEIDDRSREKHRLESVALTIPSELAIPLPSRSVVYLSLSGERFWGSTKVFLADTNSRVLRWSVAPSAEITGRLNVPLDYSLPSQSELILSRVALNKRSDVPDEVRITCPIRTDGAWSCKIPAGRFDLRIKARGFSSRYLWGLEADSEEKLNLGNLDLSPGSSVVGWVKIPENKDFEPNCVVSIRSVDLKRSESVFEKCEYRHPEGSMGFFQFERVPPGTYVIRAGREGAMSSSKVEIEVFEGLESKLIDPLEMHPLAGLELDVRPSEDPQGMPWQISFSRVDAPEAFDGLVDSNGHWHQHEIPEGVYHLRVSTYAHDRWFSETINIDSAGESRTIELDAVPVVGSVTLGEEHVPATLWFGGEKGKRRVLFETDQSGYFEGLLPETGVWPVAVRLHENRDATLISSVDVSLAEGDVAEVDVVLDDTEIRGSVVRQDGAPAAGATVEAVYREKWRSPVRARASSDGTFRFRGLAPGSIMFSARSGELTSEETTLVYLEEDEIPPQVRLVLGRRIEMNGQIFSATGPIPKATVFTLPRFETEMGGRFADIRHVTGLDGEFHFSVPEQAKYVDLIVLAYGFAARFLTVPARAGEAILVEVDSDAGTLELEWPAITQPSQGWPISPYLVAHGRVSVSLSIFNRWAKIHQGKLEPNRLLLPMMEPGTYRICLPARASSGTHPECVEGFLPNNNPLRLSLGN